MTWEEKSFYSFIVTCVLLFLVGAVPLIDGRKGKVRRLLKRNQKVAQLGLGLLAVLCQVIQFISNQKAEDFDKLSRDSALFHYQDSLAHRYKRDLDSNEKRIIGNYTTALAKFGLRSDSVSGKIVKIVEQYSGLSPIPELGFCEFEGLKVDSVIGKKHYFSIAICNNQAPSSDVELSMYFAYEGDSVIHPVVFRNKDYLVIAKEEMSTGHTGVFLRELEFKYKCDIVYCLLKGRYIDSKKKTHYVKKIASFDIKTKTFGYPILIANQSLINELKQVGFY